MRMPKLLKEPLVHFLALGALIFAGYEAMNQGVETDAGRIVVTQGRIDNLGTAFNRVWQRPPTASELNGLIQEHIREEVLAREAMALGLDNDDTVIRRRLRQKMEFIANDLAVPEEPAEVELEAFLVNHPELFRVEPRFTFRQVYLNDGKHDVDIPRLLAELNLPGAKIDFRTLGDVTMLYPALTDVTASDITSQFGEGFTRQLEQIPIGRWEGPVTSGYGLHLVFIEERTSGSLPKLADVRERVAREWTDARRREGNERFYQELLKRYVVTIEGTSTNAPGNAVAAQLK
jgi:hypothetical protein